MRFKLLHAHPLWRRTVVVILTVAFSIWSVSSYQAFANSSSFRFVSWADTKSAISVLASLSNQANPLSPDFTIYAGDLCESGFTVSCMDAWKDAMNGNSNNGMFDKTFPVRGNHDSNDTAGWQAYFDLQATALRIGATNYTELNEDLTYSFDYGNSHFIGVDVLGDATGLSPTQISWIDNDLAAAEQRGLTHAFIYFHGPIYCLANHCACTTRTCATPLIIASLADVFNRHPIVSATFHGHEHTYAFVHIDSSRIPEVLHPFEQFVTGDAGAGPAGCSKTYRFDYCMDSHGFVTVDVFGNTFTVNFYTQDNMIPVKTLTFGKHPLPLVDFDGDQRTDIAAYHSASGLWFIKPSSGVADYYVGYAGTDYAPVPGDYDADGKTDITVYHAASGLWFIKKSSDETNYDVGYGGPNYKPVPGDYDGDRKMDIAVYHAASGLWFIKKSLEDTSYSVGYGGASYVPVPGDYDGDGKTDIAVYHSVSGLWFIKKSSDATSYSVGYGGTDYKPVPGDYDGDGKTDIAVYHSATGLWFIKRSSDSTSYHVGYGGTTYYPVPGDYDGDGKTDIAVYHSASGLWFIKPSSGTADYYVGYGGPGYVPVNLDYLLGWVY